MILNQETSFNQNKKFKKRKDLWKNIKKQKALILMSAPFVIWCIIFSYMPIWGWIMAFQNYKPGLPILKQEWVGLYNFKSLFSSSGFYLAMRNTIVVSFMNLFLGYTTAIGLALLLNEVKSIFFKRTVQTISYLPHFISWVVGANIVITMLSFEGPINKFLLWAGAIKKPIMFLGVGKFFWGILATSNIWKETGWSAIIFLAAISMINPELYESSDIDGANRLQKAFYITLPGIKSTFFILFIMSIGNILSTGFEQPYLLMNALVKDYAENLDIYVLRTGISQVQYSFATAAGIFKSLVSLILIFMANKIAKNMGEKGIM